MVHDVHVFCLNFNGEDNLSVVMNNLQHLEKILHCSKLDHQHPVGLSSCSSTVNNRDEEGNSPDPAINSLHSVSEQKARNPGFDEFLFTACTCIYILILFCKLSFCL